MPGINLGVAWLLGIFAVVMAVHGVFSVIVPERQVDLRARMGRPSFSTTGFRIIGVFEIGFAIAIGVVLAVTLTRGH